jgi:N-acetylglucosaminyl-diphospho-decaprenol L-rhamnosyltransferase
MRPATPSGGAGGPKGSLGPADFGQRARAAGLDLHWVGGADAFHQHHPVSDPPVEHLDDILRNGAHFAARWGWWPMEGWLRAFAERGLIRPEGDGWTRI